MIMRYDDKLNAHNHNSRRTVEQVLAHDTTQNYDIGWVEVVGHDDEYVKDFSVVLSNPERPTVTITDKTDDEFTPIVFTIGKQATHREVFQAAGEKIASREASARNAMIRRYLMKNGYRAY